MLWKLKNQLKIQNDERMTWWNYKLVRWWWESLDAENHDYLVSYLQCMIIFVEFNSKIIMHRVYIRWKIRTTKEWEEPDTSNNQKLL